MKEKITVGLFAEWDEEKGGWYVSTSCDFYNDEDMEYDEEYYESYHEDADDYEVLDDDYYEEYDDDEDSDKIEDNACKGH